MSYDTAFNAHVTPFHKRTQVYEHVASHLITSALSNLASRGHDCTRNTMGSALQSLEATGLETLETAACDAITDGVGAVFCGELFSGSFGTWLNGRITSSSIVQQFNTKLIDTCTSALPAGYLSKIDTVCQAYHDVSAAVGAASAVRSCARNSRQCGALGTVIMDAGSSLAQSHFGYSAGGGGH